MRRTTRIDKSVFLGFVLALGITPFAPTSPSDPELRAIRAEARRTRDLRWLSALQAVCDDRPSKVRGPCSPKIVKRLLNPCDTRVHDVMRSGNLQDCYNNKPLPSRKVEVFVDVDYR